MRLTEYQSMGILIKYGIPIPNDHFVSNTVATIQNHERETADISLENQSINFKTQEQGNKQTQGDVGETEFFNTKNSKVNPGMVHFSEKKINIQEKLFLVVKIDPTIEKPVISAYKLDSEKFSGKSSLESDNRIYLPIDLSFGLLDYQIRKIAVFLEIPKDLWEGLFSILERVWKIFIELDANSVEINPLVKDSNNNFVASSAIIELDEKAFFRHPEFDQIRESTLEYLPQNDYGLHSYQFPNGNIGCIVNSETFGFLIGDRLQEMGCAINVLQNIGTKSAEKKVLTAIDLIKNNKDIDCILVAIFGDLTFCDGVFQEINQLAQNDNLQIPIVIYLNGTNIDSVDFDVAIPNQFYFKTLEKALIKCADLLKIGNG